MNGVNIKIMCRCKKTHRGILKKINTKYSRRFFGVLNQLKSFWTFDPQYVIVQHITNFVFCRIVSTKNKDGVAEK